MNFQPPDNDDPRDDEQKWRDGLIALAQQCGASPYAGELIFTLQNLEALAKALAPHPETPALRGEREALNKARIALLEMAKACDSCKNGPDGEFCCRLHQWQAIESIDAALAAPVPQSAAERCTACGRPLSAGKWCNYCCGVTDAMRKAFDDRNNSLEADERDDIIAAVLALAPGLSGWQPIETAPKDGTVVLLWERYNDVPIVGAYSTHRGKWYADASNYDTSGDAVVIDKLLQEYITHWQPITASGIAPDQPQPEPATEPFGHFFKGEYGLWEECYDGPSDKTIPLYAASQQRALSDEEIDNFAHSACEEALAFGLSVDVFKRYIKAAILAASSGSKGGGE